MWGLEMYQGWGGAPSGGSRAHLLYQTMSGTLGTPPFATILRRGGMSPWDPPGYPPDALGSPHGYTLGSPPGPPVGFPRGSRWGTPWGDPHG